jgi:hypothetical protein
MCDVKAEVRVFYDKITFLFYIKHFEQLTGLSCRMLFIVFSLITNDNLK